MRLLRFAFAPSWAAAREPGTMLYVSLVVEALRAHPRLMFWTAALAQAAVWTLVPVLFYAAPPGDLAVVLAVGREGELGSPYGPPLAYWLADAAFRLAGARPAGVYVLAQLCVVVTYWAVFALGRAIVGTQHAAMAVLLMVGVVSFSVPTPDFGPGVLAMPLTALTLLFAWRAITANRHGDWLTLALVLGSLLLTSYHGLIVAVLVIGVLAGTARGRSRLGGMDPWGAMTIVVLMAFPHLLWLEQTGWTPLPGAAEVSGLAALDGRLAAFAGLVGNLLVAHGGLVVLVTVAGGVQRGRSAHAPAFERAAVDDFSRRFVYLFALAPVLVAALVAAAFDWHLPIGASGSLVVLSALAVVVAAGDVVHVRRERVVGIAWLTLLLLPPAVTVLAVLLGPWTVAAELQVGRPAVAMGAFFTDNFRRRTGAPLAFVVGEAKLAATVAAASPDRPSAFLDADPARAPWVDAEALRRDGAVVVWVADDPGGTPPPGLKALFPELVPEIPRAFERAVQGRLPLLRIGWGIVRPQGAPPPR